MTRTVVLPIFLVAACGVGEVDLGGGMDSGAAERNVCVPKVAAAAVAHNHAAAGANPAGARSGLGCMATGGCHGPSPGSSVFAFAGTAYKQLAGSAVAPGVTVRVFKAGSDTALGKAVTDDAGNFYIAGNFSAFPYQVDITACGSGVPGEIIPMQNQINNTGEANCSASGACHAIPGTQAVYIASP